MGIKPHVSSNLTLSATSLGALRSKAFFFAYCVSVFELLRCDCKGVFDHRCASSLALCIEVSIGVCCDGYGAVSEPSLDFLHVLTVGEHQRCTGVSKVMESDLVEPVPAKEDGEVIGYVVWL